MRGWDHAQEKESTQLVQRIKLETVVPIHRVDEITSVIVEKGQTGNYGDGNKPYASEPGKPITMSYDN